MACLRPSARHGSSQHSNSPGKCVLTEFTVEQLQIRWSDHPFWGRENYDASGPFKVTDNWKFGEGPKVRSMYVEGFVIDSIKSKKPYAADGIILNEWLSAGGWTNMSALPPVAKFLLRVQKVFWMRRHIITEHDLGLAPEMSKKRDIICIIYDCRVPVALPMMVILVADEEYFTFIGECYVHGIMDSEAVGLARSRSGNEEIPKKVFELR